MNLNLEINGQHIWYKQDDRAWLLTPLTDPLLIKRMHKLKAQVTEPCQIVEDNISIYLIARCQAQTCVSNRHISISYKNRSGSNYLKMFEMKT